MIKTPLYKIAEWAGAYCPAECRGIEIDNIVKDSREARPGSLFIPLPGTRFDGHDFIASAAQRGAYAALCGRDGIAAATALLRVRDTLRAFQNIAAGYKASFTLKTVGITGSVGKTTTARMAAAVAGTAHRLLTTGEDSNGQIGLPFALFGLDGSQSAAVLEMGMSQPGELARLSKVARPDIAVINNIGTAHIEFFGTRERIRDAKLEITRGMPPDGTLILNGDEPLLWELREKTGLRTVYFGIENKAADVRGYIISDGPEGARFHAQADGEHLEVALPASGAPNVSNALAALAAGLALGVPLRQGAAALAHYTPARGRQNITVKNGITIIDDSYNASPESVEAALDVLAARPGRRFAALGAMLELGEYTDSGHERCGEYAAGRTDYLLTYGDGGAYRRGAVRAGMPPGRVTEFAAREELVKSLAALARPGDAVLFKGSHGTGMAYALKIFLEYLLDEGVK